MPTAIHTLVALLLDVTLHALVTGIVLHYILRRVSIRVEITGGGGGGDGDDLPIPPAPRKAKRDVVWS